MRKRGSAFLPNIIAQLRRKATWDLSQKEVFRVRKTKKTWIFTLGCVLLTVLGGAEVALADGIFGSRLQEDVTRRFEAFLKREVRAERVQVALRASDEELQAGNVPEVRIFCTGALLGDLRCDRLVVLLRAVNFRPSGEDLLLEDMGQAEVSGTVLEKDCEQSLKRTFPDLKNAVVRLEGHRVVVAGAYAKSYVVPVRAFVKLYGKYVLDPQSGEASLTFEKATNDNPFISTEDIAKSLSRKSLRLSLAEFFVKPPLRDVRVDKRMVWFTTKP